ncbi:phosphotransferase [Solibacillus sp. CAU 1738]|uniref:phosphotransferase n=1 Tax=Solibacillus sp. CAU 1738 TaxID=3140363 RepID=UPI003261730B
MKKSSSDIYEEIKETVESLFNLKLRNEVPLQLGLLNLKWKVESDGGEYVIKQFSRERYERFDIGEVAIEQEVALREQLRQYYKGTPCPRILTCNDKVIHMTRNEERFTIMTYLPGENLLPGTLNEAQMFSFGQRTGQMHNIFNDGTNEKGVPKFIPPSTEQRLQYWEILKEENNDNLLLINSIEQQILATKEFNLDELNEYESGWTHRDLWVDNVLFNSNELSAILDFDRVAYDYLELDIARAIMSGALMGNVLNLAAAKSFLNGYRTRRNFEKGALVRSLKLLWYLESTWWITPKINHNRYQEIQFYNEMVWLGANFPNLEKLFGDY